MPETGSQLLLVCHTRQIPAHLGAVLAGTGYQLLTGLSQALRGPGPRPRSRPDAAAEAVLSGPGLNAPLVTAQTAERIRAGVAHPVIAAGIAAVLVTGAQAMALASTPWDALSPENDTLQLTWHPPSRQLVPASLAASPAPPPPPSSIASLPPALGLPWRGYRGGPPTSPPRYPSAAVASAVTASRRLA